MKSIMFIIFGALLHRYREPISRKIVDKIGEAEAATGKTFLSNEQTDKILNFFEK